jgi:hypothetical protein
MKLHGGGWLALLLGAICLTGCAARPAPALAILEESSVRVSLWLEVTQADRAVLKARFEPLEAGYHLYSKDLPRDGVDGLGRPTLLELTPASVLQPIGDLSAEPALLAEPVFPDLQDLRVYPAGPVTLRLPVRLPPGLQTWNDEAALTYMICAGAKCKRPVEARIVLLAIQLK